MIDFSIIKVENDRIWDGLNLREKVLESALAEGFANIKDIPNDFYSFEEGLLGDEKSKALDEQFQELTLDYMRRQFVLSLDLTNALMVLNKLQSVGIKKQQEVMEQGSGEDSKETLRKNFLLAVSTGEAEKTYEFKANVEKLVRFLDSTMKHFEVPYPEQDSETTVFCREKNDLISDEMNPELFNELQNEFYARVCQNLNELADLNLGKIDVELGYFYHYDYDYGIDPECLERKGMVFLSIMAQADDMRVRSAEYLDAVQRHQNPESVLGPDYSTKDLN